MNITDLQQQAITIRDEDNRSANTATRVGRAILDTVNALAENATAVATNKANIATNTTDLANIKAFYRGDLGNHATWTEATARLDLMSTDGSVNGQYQISVGDIPFIVNFALLNNSDKIFTQSVIGSATINSDGTLSTSHGIAVNIFSRTYTNATWSNWTRLAAQGDVPTVQTSEAGTNRNYVYQDITNSTKYVLSGVGKLFQYNGGLKLRLKVWGTGNTSYDDGKYSTFDCPQVTSSADGAMNRTIYGRLLNQSIYTGASTTTAVVVNYTDIANGGSKTFTIAAANTARAGVMSVAHVNALNSLTSHIVDLGHFTSEEEALRKLGTLGTCNDKNLVHAHLTYNVGSSSTKNTLILIQSIHDNYCRQFIFNKDKVFQRGLTFADDSLSQITLQEDWSLLFGDRLAWSEGNHGYVLSQFGQGYGHSMCDPIPYASATADGLMSKEDYQLLQKIKAQLNL